MKDKIYLGSLNFIKEKVKNVFEMPGEIGFITRFSLFFNLREQQIIYKEKVICSNSLVATGIAYIKLNVEMD